MSNRYSFIGGKQGTWQVTSMDSYRGASLETVNRIEVVNGVLPELTSDTAWVLQGLTSNVRYSTRLELNSLRERQPTLNRPEALCAALIPIKKSAVWWEMPQDERRAIFEETSHHTNIGLEFLPAIARRLHHSRDIGEPFDFLTWFEYAPEHTNAFENLVARLRTSQEWDFVEREIDIRLVQVRVNEAKI